MYSFTLKSNNAKTGPIPVTYSPKGTCPDACPYIDDGCYAETGWYTNMHWNRISAGTAGIGWRELIDNVAALPEGTVWRHNIAGDLPHIAGQPNAISLARLDELIEANAGKRGFTYTHHALTPWNRAAVMRANMNGLTINISTDSPKWADIAYDMAIGPVVTVVPSGKTHNFYTPAGNVVVICPATQRDDVTCATCKLCAVPGRTTIIGFPAHGNGAKKVDQKLVRWYK